MNSFEIALAFVEGLALIASPCILPVLPLVLGASADGGRKRPFGVIAGFVVSFSLFAIVSRKIVNAFGINLDIIKYTSLALLAVFGCILVSDKLTALFSRATQASADWGNRFSAQGSESFWSGVALGALIGLIWTPCAGPILAAVLVQVIKQQDNLSGYFIIFAFALGAGVPMLIIALMGRKIMQYTGTLSRHTEWFRKLFGVLIIGSALFIASGVDIGGLLPAQPETPVALRQQSLVNGLDAPYPAPDIAGIETWFNSAPLDMAQLRGKVVLVDFWTYSCINCVRTLPYITRWDTRYRKDGLVIIGIHAPEFEFEKNPDNVKAALVQYGIQYPVALDNHLSTWTNFNNSYWPAHYLINKEGKIVYTHFGEGHYDITENNIRYLLGLTPDKNIANQEPLAGTGKTPETYLGYARAERFAGGKSAESSYILPSTIAEHYWALQGKWKADAEHITALEKDASLRIHFHASKVFLVLGTQDNTPVQVEIRLNGTLVNGNAGKDAPHGVLTVNHHALYELVSQADTKSRMLEITSKTPGLEAYAFTFGD